MFELVELTSGGPRSVGIVLGLAGESVSSVVMFRHPRAGLPIPRRSGQNVTDTLSALPVRSWAMRKASST